MRTSGGTTKLLAVAMTVGMVAVLLFAPRTRARAQIGDQPTIRSIGLAPGFQPEAQLVALIGQNDVGTSVLGAIDITADGFEIGRFSEVAGIRTEVDPVDFLPSGESG